MIAQSRPAPALAAGLSPRPFPAAPPAFAIRAALRARRALLALADRLVPAQVAVFERSVGAAWTQVLGVAARHALADVLADGPLSADEIAARTGLDADALHRVLRGLAFGGVFRLRGDGRFENNRLSDALRGGRPHRAREWVEYFASGSNVRAWHDLDATVRSGEGAFGRVHGMGVWDWFDREPHERETFAQAMMGLTIADAPVVASLYPFGEVQTVCDVGGGRGTLLSEILIRHEGVRGVLCDGEGVVASAASLLEARGVAGRVECVPGDFFASVPTGCGAYVLKNILHDWDDERCRAILRVVRRAATPGARVLVVESLLERNEARSHAVLADLQMMVVTDGGRERSRAELEALLADTGFRPARVFPFPTVAILEGIAV
jgi:hypothetical protein